MDRISRPSHSGIRYRFITPRYSRLVRSMVAVAGSQTSKTTFSIFVLPRSGSIHEPVSFAPSCLVISFWASVRVRHSAVRSLPSGPSYLDCHRLPCPWTADATLPLCSPHSGAPSGGRDRCQRSTTYPMKNLVDRFCLDSSGRENMSGLGADRWVVSSELMDDYNWDAVQVGGERRHVG
jgi:hypothetical protein